MKLTGGVASHVGNVRGVNQDRAYFGGSIAAVADGMGGHQGGEIAAQVAVSGFDGLSRPIECDELLTLVSDANSAVFDKAIDPDLRGMGTTLVVLALQPGEDVVNIANVGDSRAYHYRDGNLRQITVDHSLVQDLVTAGKITKEEAEVHPQRNIVTRALGISPTVEPDYFTLPAQVGDRFLLCSDGLFNEVDEDRIAEMLDAEDVEYVANKLVQAAINEAGRDNVTVAVVDIVEGTLEPVEAAAANGEVEEDPTIPINDLEDTLAAPDGDVEASAEEADLTPFPDDAEATTQVLPVTESATVEDTVPVENGFDSPLGEEPAPEAFSEADIPTAPMDIGPLEAAQPIGPVTEPTKPSRKGLVFLAFLALLLAAIAAGGFFFANRVTENSWFVGESNGKVAVFHGHPEGRFWFTPEEVADQTNEIPNVELADLDSTQVAAVQANETFDSLDQAVNRVKELAPEPELEAVPADEPTEPEAVETTTTTVPVETTQPEAPAQPGAETTVPNATG